MVQPLCPDTMLLPKNQEEIPPHTKFLPYRQSVSYSPQKIPHPSDQSIVPRQIPREEILKLNLGMERIVLSLTKQMSRKGQQTESPWLQAVVVEQYLLLMRPLKQETRKIKDY